MEPRLLHILSFFNWYTSFGVCPQMHKRLRFTLKGVLTHLSLLKKDILISFRMFGPEECNILFDYKNTILHKCDKYWSFKTIKVNDLCLVTCSSPISWFFGEWKYLVHMKQKTVNFKMITKNLHLVKFRTHKLTTSSVACVWYSDYSITRYICITVVCIPCFSLDRVSSAHDTGTSASVISCTTDFNRISFNYHTW